MSADNWTTCPRCEAKREADIEKRAAKADAMYGKASIEAFDTAREELAALRQQEPRKTFREDYEIGIVEGEFSVDYRGSCETCGFAHSFKFVDAVDTSIKPRTR